MNERSIFMEALAKEGAERSAYLAEACCGDAALLQRVEALIQSHEGAGNFLAKPVAERLAEQQGVPLAKEAMSGSHPAVEPESGTRSGTVIGPYKLLQQIGEGGMGTVFMAEQTEPVQRTVALKLIKPGLDSRQVIARFEAERQALALMDHPNIAKVLDAGTTSGVRSQESGVRKQGDGEGLTPEPCPLTPDAGRPYFVMELVKGVPITKYCDEHHLTPRERLELFVPVCQAVQHAHQKGIIHRDLKPSNVMVCLYDGRPVPKVIDFGVAKAAGPKLTERTLFTELGQVVGTLEYMSPEQAELNQLDVDTRSDIYSLGVLLYELLTGTTPLERGRLKQAAFLEVLRLIREEEPPRPSTRLSTTEELPSIAANRGLEPKKLSGLVRGELDWIVMKALEKDRDRRYESANAFAMDVQRYLSDEAVQACPPSAAYRFRKFARRNKGPALAVSLVFIALLAGIVGTTLGLVRAEAAATSEKLAKERAEANFTLAKESVERFLGTVTDDSALKRADFHDLRKKLLETAIPFFQKIAEQSPGNSHVEAARGEAYHRLALVRAAMGENAAAVENYEAMRAIFARLAADFPTVPAYAGELANSHNNLGILLADLGKLEAAEVAHQQAIDIQAKLAADFPTITGHRQDLARSHNNLATLLTTMGRHGEAEAAYRQALGIQVKLTADFPAVPAYRSELTATYVNLGVLLVDLGKRAEAEAADREAVNIQAKLAAEFPTVPAYRHDLARSYDNLAILLTDTGKLAESEAARGQALSIYAKLVAEFPTVPAYRQDQARTNINLGRTLAALEKRREAEAAAHRALDICAKLVADFPTVLAYHHDLARSHNNLAVALSDLEKRGEADVAYRQAMTILEKLSADFPAVPMYAVDLGCCYCNFGQNLLRNGGPAETALAWFQKAIDRLRPVAAHEPRLVSARLFLRNSYWRRASLFDGLGRHAEAEQDWERALEFEDGSAKEEIRARLLLSRLGKLRKQKDAAGFLATAAEYESLNLAAAGGLYDAACVRALCAALILEDTRIPATDAPRLAKEQGDRAMAWLHQAVAQGWKAAEHMRQDRDLDALRGRADFQKLLTDLKAKEK
jgi:serine/threonine protein kinase/tetratricopeptide (TPR) repeat protein